MTKQAALSSFSTIRQCPIGLRVRNVWLCKLATFIVFVTIAACNRKNPAPPLAEHFHTSGPVSFEGSSDDRVVPRSKILVECKPISISDLTFYVHSKPIIDIDNTKVIAFCLPDEYLTYITKSTSPVKLPSEIKLYAVRYGSKVQVYFDCVIRLDLELPQLGQYENWELKLLSPEGTTTDVSNIYHGIVIIQGKQFRAWKIPFSADLRFTALQGESNDIQSGRVTWEKPVQE